MSRWLAAFAACGLGFVVYTQVVGLGLAAGGDQATAQLLAPTWREWLRPVAIGVALLGGAEVTAVVAGGLAVYLARSGFRNEAWALLALVVALAAEVAYKLLLHHPAPTRFPHGDGPSLTMLLEGGRINANSYPSGHTLRAVLVYGLLAFVIHRLAPAGPWRRVAVPVAAVIIALVAFDRLYLGVHWASDVMGGLLLGGLLLAGAIAWLDKPRRAA
jgi:undecaprenyl-diphosphatase